MSKGYHRFCLTDLSEFLNLKVSNLWRGQRERKDKCFNLFTKYNFTKLLSELV